MRHVRGQEMIEPNKEVNDKQERRLSTNLEGTTKSNFHNLKKPF